MDLPAQYSDYRSLGALSYAEREKAVALQSRFQDIQAAEDTVATMRLVAAQEGIAFGTLRRKFYAWRKGGAAAIADRRRAKTGASENLYYGEFKRYAERDLNTSMGGYAAMLRDLRAGKAFAFGTWRDCWMRDYPLESVPPFCPANYTPHGLTYANMMRLQKADASRPMALAWSRQGQFAAIRHTLPVVRSRIGLHPGEVVESDDVWHNIDVFKAGLKGVFNPLEFAFYDVASAFKVVSAVKPRMLVVDPKTGKEKRDNLKEFQYRMAVAYMMCVTGFYKGGITLIGERGTTALREPVLKRIASVPGYGSRFRFQVSGVKNTPAHKGLFIGNAGGNPRMKSLCECAHNIIHNATASLPGSHGRDAAHLHESNAALVKYSTDMIEQARRLSPDLVTMLQLPILDFDTYMQYFRAIEDEVMDRTETRLEGWEQNFVMEYRLAVGSPWRKVSELKDMRPEQAQAVSAVLAQDRYNLMRQRKMSRREVWAAGQKDLDRWPLIDMPAFLDVGDMREATVRPDGTIAFEDSLYYPGQIKRYIAQYSDRKTGVMTRLAPGQKVKFFWNALGTLANQIWLADDSGDVLGMCPILQTAAWADEQSIKVAMGQQQAQIAALMADTRAGGAAEGVRRLAAEKLNAALIDAGGKALARPLVADGGGKVSLEDLSGGGADIPQTADERDEVDIDFLSAVSRV